VELRDEVLSYPGETEFEPTLASPDIVVTLRLATDATKSGELSFFSTGSSCIRCIGGTLRPRESNYRAP
jgi:hypothetical protein